ncbi:MAG: hypothetical protein A2539_10680 [Elusimicrobia bacterium RIFOXYD2_FULL_34_15]|nr:MAG: hypothetical protein A2539_10680 [Elusimicrobia bacterium RIFOXYD2_FULL_34_15]
MLILIILFSIVIFFAINMGASGIAPSFAVSFCTKIIKRKTSILLFGLFVVLGAILLGHNVTKTLGGGILQKNYFSFNIVLIILFSSSLGLFIANVLKVPQSTSWATVFSIVGSGVSIGHINWEKFLIIIPFWIILPLASYFLTLFFYSKIYPPKFKNLWVYEKIFINEKTIKKLSIIASCYVAFAIGTNNVANAVGPLVAGGFIKNITFGLFFIGLLFIFGAFFWGEKTMCTMGNEIVALGTTTATIINLVTATLLIFASVLGIPQSLVQLNAASVFAVSHTKNGFYQTASHKITKKTLLVWLISPSIAFLSSFLLTGVIK